MKILIAYGTKAGTTRECAKEIKAKLSDTVELVDLKEFEPLDLNKYDWFIIGTPIYAGTMEKHVKKFILRNEKSIESKLLGFYTCGLGDEKESYNSIVKITSLITKTKVYKHLGGEVHYENLHGFLKMIAKQMVKNAEGNKKRDKGKVDEFVDSINSFLGSNDEKKS